MYRSLTLVSSGPLHAYGPMTKRQAALSYLFYYNYYYSLQQDVNNHYCHLYYCYDDHY